MATISIDYDSNGDIELILEEKDNTPLNQAAQQASPSSEQEKPAKYNVGPLSVKVKEVRLRVSSLKLISSSRYFQAMLEGSRFHEGEELKEHGFVEIKLLDPEDEPTAMMIILGILYENDVQVPIELATKLGAKKTRPTSGAKIKPKPAGRSPARPVRSLALSQHPQRTIAADGLVGGDSRPARTSRLRARRRPGRRRRLERREASRATLRRPKANPSDRRANSTRDASREGWRTQRVAARQRQRNRLNVRGQVNPAAERSHRQKIGQRVPPQFGDGRSWNSAQLLSSVSPK